VRYDGGIQKGRNFLPPSLPPSLSPSLLTWRLQNVNCAVGTLQLLVEVGAENLREEGREGRRMGE